MKEPKPPALLRLKPIIAKARYHDALKFEGLDTASCAGRLIYIRDNPKATELPDAARPRNPNELTWCSGALTVYSVTTWLLRSRRKSVAGFRNCWVLSSYC